MVIIGAGIVDGSIFRKLTKYRIKIAVLEKENDVAIGSTKANSAIVHAGYDPIPETLTAKCNVKGNEMCNQLHVSFVRNESLVIGFDEEDIKTIKVLYEKGLKMECKTEER